MMGPFSTAWYFAEELSEISANFLFHSLLFSLLLPFLPRPALFSTLVITVQLALVGKDPYRITRSQHTIMSTQPSASLFL